jgi:hypothetical protein
VVRPRAFGDRLQVCAPAHRKIPRVKESTPHDAHWHGMLRAAARACMCLSIHPLTMRKQAKCTH